jgi:hypothetical protein
MFVISAAGQLLKFRSKYLRAITAQLAIAITSVVIQLPAKAATFLVTERTAFESNDQVDWASLGTPFTPLPNNLIAASQRDLELGVSIPQTTNPLISQPLVFQTTSNPGGIRTNFANGDYILFAGIDVRAFSGNAPIPTDGNGGPITITFDKPVFGAGTQIAVDDRSTFDAYVRAYDSENNLLASFSAQGTSSLLLDNSALFLGVRSDSANISRLVFSSSFPQQGLAINSVSILAVPEASSNLAMLVFGVFSVLWKLSS